jgi:hypothetical protein
LSTAENTGFSSDSIQKIEKKMLIQVSAFDSIAFRISFHDLGHLDIVGIGKGKQLGLPPNPSER